MLLVARRPAHERIHGCGAGDANAGAYQQVGPRRESIFTQAGITTTVGGMMSGKFAADPNEYA